MLAETGLDDWQVLRGELHAWFATDGLSAGVRFAARLAEAADAANHHPDLTVSYPRVGVVLTTHDAGGLTAKDVDMARTISGIAAEAGVHAEPGRAQMVEIGIDALDIGTVRAFWAAVTGMTPDGDDALVDPTGALPPIWFQQMDAPRPQRNRVHLDVIVGVEAAEGRVAAAVRAGGTLLDETHAPAFWVLADAEGNEACVCTQAGRD